MGDVPGIVSWLRVSSVVDVRNFIDAVRRCRRGKLRPVARDESIVRLLTTLLVPDKSKDPRPLQQTYLELVPACSEAYVSEWLERPKPSNYELPIYKLLRSHPIVLRDHVDERIRQDQQAHCPWSGRNLANWHR